MYAKWFCLHREQKQRKLFCALTVRIVVPESGGDRRQVQEWPGMWGMPCFSILALVTWVFPIGDNPSSSVIIQMYISPHMGYFVYFGSFLSKYSLFAKQCTVPVCSFHWVRKFYIPMWSPPKQNWEHLLNPRKSPCDPLQANLSPWRKLPFYFPSKLRFFCSWSSYKWNHTAFGRKGLASISNCRF